MFLVSSFLFEVAVAGRSNSYVIQCLGKAPCLPRDLRGMKKTSFEGTYVFSSVRGDWCSHIRRKSNLCFKNLNVRFFPADEIKEKPLEGVDPSVSENAELEGHLQCVPPAGARKLDYILSAGQVLTGTELIREERDSATVAPVSFSVIDGYLDPSCISREANPVPAQCTTKELLHGTSVSNILLARGNGAFVLSNPQEKVKFHDFFQMYLDSGAWRNSSNTAKTAVELSTAVEIVDQVKKEKADVINFSGYLGLTAADLKNPTSQDIQNVKNANEFIFEKFHELARAQTLVIAAGNDDSFSPELEKFASDDMFVAGSVYGKDLDQTVNRNKVTAYVPSGNFGMSGSFNTHRSGTLATSSAAPVLSGAIANVKAILPKISNKNLKTLISKTGIPTRFGAPFLNSYKMFRVAKEISKKCSGEDGCITREIDNPASYNYEAEAKRALEKAKHTIGSKAKSSSCLSQKELNAAIKAYLLHPTVEARNFFESLPKNTPNISYPVLP